MIFFSAFVMLCSSTAVAFSLRPAYSRTTVGTIVMPYFCASIGLFSASTYSVVTCFDR